MNKNSTEAESTIIAENFAKWALNEDTALPDTSNQIIARMTYDAVGLMYAARNENYILSVTGSAIEKGFCWAVGSAISPMADLDRINRSAISPID